MREISSKIRIFLIVIGLGIGYLLAGVDMTAFNLALVWIQKDLTLSLSATDWVINSYFLTFAAFLVPAGRLGDIYGHKSLFLIGMTLFAISAFMGGFADKGWQLIWARGMQGIGGALFWPGIQAITMHFFSKEKVTKILGIILGIGGIGFAGGPYFSGLILQYFSWRYVFWMNVPIAFLSFIIILFSLPKEVRSSRSQRLDFVGLIFLGCFCFSLVYALDLGGRIGFNDREVLGWFAATLGLIFLFVVRQDRADNPLIELPVMYSTKFFLGMLFRIAMSFTFFTILFFLGYALQHIALMRPEVAGTYFLPFTVGFALLSVVGGFLGSRFNIKRVMYLGMYLMAIGSISLGAVIWFTLDLSYLFIPLSLAGLGLGLFLPNNSFFSVSSLPKTHWGLGTGIMYMTILIFAAVSIVVASIFMKSPGYYIVMKLIQSEKIALSEMKIELIESVMKGMRNIPEAMAEFGKDSKEIYAAIKQGFLQAMSFDLFFCGTFILIPMVIYQLYTNRRVQK